MCLIPLTDWSADPRACGCAASIDSVHKGENCRRIESSSTHDVQVDSLWTKLSGEMQARVKVALLQAIFNEPQSDIRHKLVDTTSELAGAIFQLTPQSSARDWPELMQFMFRLVSSPTPAHREAGFLMFTRLSNFVMDGLQGPQVVAVKEAFARGLQEDDMTVRLACMSAAVSFIEFNFDDQTKKEFQKMLPKMAEIISKSLTAGKEEDARTAIGMFVELAEVDPLFFRPVIGPFCELSAKIMTTQTLEDNTRQVALEFLVTLCESKPGMMRKVPNFIPSLVNMCLAMLLELEHDKDWFTRSADAVELTNSDVASEALDRLCLCLTGRVMVPILNNVLPNLMRSQNWKQRYAALQTMCIMGEGCNEQVSDDLEGFVKMMVPFISDEHPRVRYASLNTLGQMCTDFGPVLQEEYHALILPRLLTQMETEQVPKVQAHCCAVLINWCEDLDPQSLGPYIQRIMVGLGNVIQKGSVVAQEQALVALAAVAECLQELFIPFYDAFMPLCKTIFLRASGKNFRALQGKAIDAITIMAAAVGATKFQPDAPHILPAMVALQKQRMSSDDPMLTHLMQGWARLCRCLKEHFVPYLPVVMPNLLQSASMQPETQMATNENYDSLHEEGAWNFRTVAGESFAVKSSMQEEKVLACNMIYCYAQYLEEDFMPYVSDCAKIMVPLLNYYLDDSTRQSVAAAIPKLLNCLVCNVVKRNGSQALVADLWRAVLPVILEALGAEMDPMTIISKITCLKECVEVLGKGCLNMEQLQACLAAFMASTFRCLKQKYQLSVRENEEDFDDVERTLVDSEQQMNEHTLTSLADLHCQLIKANAPGYMELLPKLQVEGQVLLRMIVSMAEKPITNTDLQIAICMMDDVVEFGGPASAQLYQQFIPCMMKNMDHASSEVRQAAVYGIGVFFEVATEQGAQPQLVNSMVKKLHVLITAKNSRKKASVMATENAISAFAKAIEFKSACLQDEKGAVEAFVNYLPVNKDRMEARITYDRFVRMVNANRKFIFGDNLKLLPKIITILATILGTKLVAKTLNPAIINAFKSIQQNLPAPAVQQAIAMLSPELKVKLQESKLIQ